MRTDWVKRDSMDYILAALMPANRLVMECCISTGLRVTDVLELRTSHLAQRMTIKERKTSKAKRVYWRGELFQRMLAISGKLFVFEHRSDWRKHRTRQAVYNDIVRAAKLYRTTGILDKHQIVAPHSARKMFAVEEFRRTGGDVAAVAKALNHDPLGRDVTLLYALADEMTKRKVKSGSYGTRK